MAFKLTRKDLTENYAHVVEVNYCGLQHLTQHMRKVGHNEGVYGWNWTAYEAAPDVVVCTGYRNLVGTDHRATVEEFNHRAKSVGAEYSNNPRMKWDDVEKAMGDLVAEFGDRIREEDDAAE